MSHNSLPNALAGASSFSLNPELKEGLVSPSPYFDECNLKQGGGNIRY